MSSQMCFGERWQIPNFNSVCNKRKKVRRSDEMLFLGDGGVVEISMSLKPFHAGRMSSELINQILNIRVTMKFCGTPANKDYIKVDFFILDGDGYRERISPIRVVEQHVDECYLITSYHFRSSFNLVSALNSNFTPINDTLNIVPRFSVSASDPTTNDVQVPIQQTTFVETNPVKVLEKLFANDTFADFVFSVRGVEFKAHKAIVAARSTVFEAMILQDMKGKNENRAEITDVDPAVFKKLLRYAYTGKVESLCDVNIEELVQAADRYDLRGLKDICEDNLSKGLNRYTAVKLLTQANKLGCERLKTQTIEFIIRNIASIRNTDAWKELAPSQSANLISQVGSGLLEGKPLRCVQIQSSNKRKYVSSDSGSESDSD